jgi:hypothetical protein
MSIIGDFYEEAAEERRKDFVEFYQQKKKDKESKDYLRGLNDAYEFFRGGVVAGNTGKLLYKNGPELHEQVKQ